jgi:hypothetical protein
LGSDNSKWIFHKGWWIPPPSPRGSHKKNMPREIWLRNTVNVIVPLRDFSKKQKTATTEALVNLDIKTSGVPKKTKWNCFTLHNMELLNLHID